MQIVGLALFSNTNALRHNENELLCSNIRQLTDKKSYLLCMLAGCWLEIPYLHIKCLAIWASFVSTDLARHITISRSCGWLILSFIMLISEGQLALATRLWTTVGGVCSHFVAFLVIKEDKVILSSFVCTTKWLVIGLLMSGKCVNLLWGVTEYRVL